MKCKQLLEQKWLPVTIETMQLVKIKLKRWVLAFHA
jgi:hypothetical protein